MKKGLKLLTCGLVCMSTFSWKVNAAVYETGENLSIVMVKDTASLVSCVEKTENICKLEENIVLDSAVDIEKNITLDLNGHSIMPNETLVVKGGLITVIHGGTLTVNDSGKNGKITTGDSGNVYGALQVTKKGQTDITKTASIVVNGGTLEGFYYAITGNGNADRINTDITINGGKLIGTEPKEGVGIYHPQEGTLTVKGGEIVGATGIEIRAGELNVTGGTIRGTYKPIEVNSNGNGSTTQGAGIAIAQHTTKKGINVLINGGTIEGYTALYESNPENNDEESQSKVSLEIKGGTFNTINDGTNSIYSENLKEFISGGTFNTDVTKYFIKKTEQADSKTPQLYEVICEEGKKFVAVIESKLKNKAYEEDSISGEEYRKIMDEFKEEYLPEEQRPVFKEFKKLLEGKTLISAHNILYGSFIEDELVVGKEDNQPENGTEVEVTLKIPTTIEKVKDGYTRKYTVIRLHENEDGSMEVKELTATETEEGTVTFKTDKFSTFALTYEDSIIEEDNPTEENTTTETKSTENEKTIEKTDNPSTGDNTLIYFVTGIISAIGLVLTTLHITKNKNNK